MNDASRELSEDPKRRGWFGRAFVALAPSATRADIGRIAAIWLATTAVLACFAYGATAVFPESDAQMWHVTKRKLLDVWVRWDSARYLDIARRGYCVYEDGTDNTRGFPLYPYLIAALMPFHRYQHAMAQGISLAAFFLLLCVLFDVAAKRHGKAVAHRAVFYMCIFPSALFFRALYAESLFTLLVLLSYRAFVNDRYARCAVYGGLAAMTRFPGIMLLPAFGVTLLWEIGRGQKRFSPAMCWIAAIAVGLAAVMLLQWQATGDALAFVHSPAHAEFSRSLSWPGASIVADTKQMATTWDFGTGRIALNLLFDDIAAVLAIALAIPLFRRYGFLAGCLSVSLILPPLMSGQTVGMIRYILPAFYYVIFLAEVGERRFWFHTLWVYASSLLLAFYTICFACWYWTA